MTGSPFLFNGPFRGRVYEAKGSPAKAEEKAGFAWLIPKIVDKIGRAHV
jgi:hypothetical protein